MYTITWAPGSESSLDQIFNDCREQQYLDRTHRYWKNYSPDYWIDAGIIANTIYFNNNNVPEMCSTISSRQCWPNNVYRILNRIWKHTNRVKLKYTREMTQGWADSVTSQINWLEQNLDYKLIFISRQTLNWQKHALEKFYNYGITLKMDNYAYLTCPNECDNTCWQNIVYIGDESVLTQWPRR